MSCAVACGRGGEEAAPHAPAQFTIRGRWEDPGDLTYRIEADGSPLDDGVFEGAVLQALEAWAETGVVAFRPAAAGEEAGFTLSWREGDHGSCTPFGMDTSVAHTGPVAAGTFVHFDRRQAWSAHGQAGHDLTRIAAHEIGHVLGLDHDPDPDALMCPLGSEAGVSDGPGASASSGPPVLGDSDRAGLCSLYGGGTDGPGDLVLQGARAEDAVSLVLRGVAPPELSEFDLFDTDGDGRDELVVWRTDPQGNGALTSYHFDARLRLVRTVGPLYGMAAPGATQLLACGRDGERLFLTVYPGGKLVARRFDEHGVLHARFGTPLLIEGLLSDADADDRLDAPLAPMETNRSRVRVTRPGFSGWLTRASDAQAPGTWTWHADGTEAPVRFAATRAAVGDANGDAVPDVALRRP